MDIKEIKKLIKNSSSVLVMDDGEPSFVILDYKTYKNIADSKEGEKEVVIHSAADSGNGSPVKSIHEREAEIIERLNKEILALKNQIEMEERGLGNPHID
jgi:hypothetical protein